MTLLERYWPTEAEVFNCIKREAETASEPVLLAVHQPMPLTVRNAGSQQETPATERDFLEAFLTNDLPEGTLIQAVTGPSGAGKSHLVRWLAAQLERDPRAKARMHVVRIPKTASLRMVVERILEPLEGEPQFAEAKAEVQKVVAEVTPRDGAIRLAAGLKIALNELSDRLTSQLRSDPRAPNARELKVKLYHAQELSHYFNDPTLEKHFTENVLARIVSRSVSGQRDPDADASLPQFEPTDLMLPEGTHLGNSSVQVRRYYQTGLNVNGGDGFARAAGVLNDKVLDQAIGEVFRLGQALGGVTLSDLIMHIRTLLFRQGRELVLLIEDFAALSGIQEALLSVCIQEAVRDGRQIRAPMRTALAVTDGYLQSRDTILTRARREWLVKTDLNDDDDVLTRTKVLVAGYLNAARWGEAELARQFRGQSEITGWVSVFRDETLTDAGADLLDAFGRSGDIPLFPYNEAVIFSLARRHLLEGGKLKFQPRTIINLILKDVLERREEYQRGTFPPPNFGSARPTAEVAAWLDRSVPAAETRARLASLLAHWGGNPVDTDDIADTHVGIFKAFSLPTPESLGLTTPSTHPSERRGRPGRQQGRIPPERLPQPHPGPTPKTDAPENPDLVRWRQRLEEWTGGKLLQQRDANYLRQTIAGLVIKAIDWNAIRVARLAAPPIFIGIPQAAGEDRSIGPRDIRLRIAETYEDPDGRLRRSLSAVVAHRLHNNSWKYGGGDEDSAVAATFIERLANRYAAEIEKKAIEEIAGLAELLLKQARVMGIAGRTSNQPESIASVALSAAPATVQTDLPEGSYEQKWHQLRDEVCANRQILQNLLTARMASFQGTGTTIHAIDTVRLREALKASHKMLPKEADINPLLSHAQNLDERRLRARALPVAQNLAQFADYVRSIIGSSFSKDDYLREAKDLVTAVEDANVWPRGYDKRAISRALEDFRLTPVQDALDRIERTPPQEAENASVDALLALVSQVDLSIVAHTRAFLKPIGEFLDAVDREAARLEQVAQSADPAPKASAIDDALAAIDVDLRNLVES